MNRVNRILPTLALLSLLFLGPVVRAQTAPAAEPPPVYQIELLAFERPGEVLEEQWPKDPGQPDPTEAIGRLSAPVTGPATVLPAGQGTLNASAYALKTHNLPPLLHLLWQQPVEDREQAKALWVEEGRIRGLIRVSLGRYLHLDVDLLLTDPATGQSYRIIDHRRMRSEQLNHLDHPKLGILVQIMPVKLTLNEPAEAETATSRLHETDLAPNQ